MRLADKTITQDLAGVVQAVYNYVCSCSTSRIETNNDHYIRKMLKLQTEDHETIISIYWLLEDTDLAVQEFFQYQLQGPTRSDNNLGEKYLRLYGILNAVYLQKSAVVQLYEHFKIPSKKSVDTAMKALTAISLRNKLAAHALDYRESNLIKNYRVAQNTLNARVLSIRVLNKNESEEFDLVKIINEFEKSFHDELYRICTHIIDKIIPKDSSIEKELVNLMKLIYARIQGHIVVVGPDPSNPVVIGSDPRFLEEE